jgi:hypothetical protein
MNMKRKLFGIVSALALSTGMATGIALAEDISIPDTVPVGITVNCGPTNTSASVSLQANGNVNFDPLDPSDPVQLESRSMDTGAIRLVMNVSTCSNPNWTVQAAIRDFTSGSDVIPGTHFQLPIGAPMSSTTALTVSGDVVVPNVTAPATDVVSFALNALAGTNNGSHNIATANGAASGQMYMDFTGELVNLDADTADGTYTALFTVSFTPGEP